MVVIGSHVCFKNTNTDWKHNDITWNLLISYLAIVDL